MESFASTSSASKAASMARQRSARTAAVRYSAPVMGGTAAAIVSNSPSAGIGTGGLAQQSMPGPPYKRLLHPQALLGLQCQRLLRLPEDQQSMRSENWCQHHDECVLTIPRISFALIGIIVVKFIGTKRECGKVIVGGRACRVSSS